MSKEKTGRWEPINPEDFELSEENEDFKQAVIARKNLTNHFTIASIEEQQANLERMERELAAQVRVTSAVLDNVERNHPDIFAMEEDKLAAAAYLHENKVLLNDSEKKLGEVKEHLAFYEDVLGVIYKKFGFVDASDVIEEADGESGDAGE